MKTLLLVILIAFVCETIALGQANIKISDINIGLQDLERICTYNSSQFENYALQKGLSLYKNPNRSDVDTYYIRNDDDILILSKYKYENQVGLNTKSVSRYMKIKNSLSSRGYTYKESIDGTEVYVRSVYNALFPAIEPSSPYTISVKSFEIGTKDDGKLLNSNLDNLKRSNSPTPAPPGDNMEMIKKNGAVFVNPNPKMWTKKDWTNIAVSIPESFKNILELYNAAIKTDLDGNYTSYAMLARRALLMEYTPFSKIALAKIENIKSQLKAKKLTQKQASDQIAEINDGELNSFMSMIQDVAVETKPIRDKNKM